MKFKEFILKLEKELKNIYLLYGGEPFFIDKAIEKILTKLGVNREEIPILNCDKKTPIIEIINKVDSLSLFSSTNIVLIKDAPIFEPEVDTSHLENVLRNISATSYVIFITRTADKRRKIYRTISKIGLVFESTPLRAWEINEWLDDKLKTIGKNMSDAARVFFYERINLLPEISLWYLENELNKVSLNSQDNEITLEDLQTNMLDLSEVSNFALTEMIDKKKLQRAIYILRTQVRVPSKIPIILALLVQHIRQLIRANFFNAQGLRGRQLGESLEMNLYIAQKISEASKTYSLTLLEEIFIKLAKADFELKTGRAGAEILEDIVIRLCKR